MPLEPSPDRGRAPGDSCSHSQFWRTDQSLFHTNDLASCFIATNTAAGGGDQIWTLGLCPFPNQSSQAPTVVNSLNPSNFYTNLSICYPSPQMLKCWEVRTNANHSPRRFLHRNLLVPSIHAAKYGDGKPPKCKTLNLPILHSSIEPLHHFYKFGLQRKASRQGVYESYGSVPPHPHPLGLS